MKSWVYLVQATTIILLKNQHKSVQHRDEADEEVKEIILKAYHFRGRKKGARQIKMTLRKSI